MPYLQYEKVHFEPYPRNGIDANGDWRERRKGGGADGGSAL
eukprot:SAG11_NODE_1200_length_5538_cov_8.582460_2_plen_41_part_00